MSFSLSTFKVLSNVCGGKVLEGHDLRFCLIISGMLSLDFLPNWLLGISPVLCARPWTGLFIWIYIQIGTSHFFID